MTFEQLMAQRPWKAIRDCPGRYVLPPSEETPADLVGAETPLHEHQRPTARDPFVVAVLEDGGGLISYRRAGGCYVHTLNTPDGLARKLQQLRVVP